MDSTSSTSTTLANSETTSDTHESVVLKGEFGFDAGLVYSGRRAARLASRVIGEQLAGDFAFQVDQASVLAQIERERRSEKRRLAARDRARVLKLQQLVAKKEAREHARAEKKATRGLASAQLAEAKKAKKAKLARKLDRQKRREAKRQRRLAAGEPDIDAVDVDAVEAKKHKRKSKTANFLELSLEVDPFSKNEKKKRKQKKQKKKQEKKSKRKRDAPPPAAAAVAATSSSTSSSTTLAIKKQPAKRPRAKKETYPPFQKIKRNMYVNCSRPKIDRDMVSVCECFYVKDFIECGDRNCTNRTTLTECHKDYCECKEHCKNQRFQKNQYAKTEVFKTGARGWGLRALEDIPAHEFVIEYVGEVITDDELVRRLRENGDADHFYFLSLGANRSIDASRRGNLARFINHSCDPNCVTQKWHVLAESRVGLFTLRDVKAGEELTFDYNFETVGGQQKECLCGAKNCRRFLDSKKESSQTRKKVRTSSSATPAASTSTTAARAAVSSSKRKRGPAASTHSPAASPDPASPSATRRKHPASSPKRLHRASKGSLSTSAPLEPNVRGDPTEEQPFCVRTSIDEQVDMVVGFQPSLMQNIVTSEELPAHLSTPLFRRSAALRNADLLLSRYLSTLAANVDTRASRRSGKGGKPTPISTSLLTAGVDSSHRSADGWLKRLHLRNNWPAPLPSDIFHLPKNNDAQ